jgi:hypothetical protein
VDFILQLVIAVFIITIAYFVTTRFILPTIATYIVGIFVCGLGLGIIYQLLRYMPTEDDLIKYREYRVFRMITRMTGKQEPFRWYGEYEDKTVGEAFRFTIGEQA